MNESKRGVESVAVVGASEKPERYSYQACERLLAHGHRVFAVSPHGRDILGAAGRRGLSEIDESLDTVTMYVGAARQSDGLVEELIAKRPGRVIFNPGAESEATERRLEAAGIATLHACTLVLLSTGQY